MGCYCGMGYRSDKAARLAAWCLVLLGPVAALSGGEAVKNSDCLECHSDKTLTKTNAAGKEVSLFVDAARLAASVHQTNTCVGCHAGVSAKHPDDNVPVPAVSCARCHARQSESYGASVHGLALAKGAERGRNVHRLPWRAWYSAAGFSGLAASFFEAGQNLRRMPRPGRQRR